MTKYAILQISDLHITKFQSEGNKRNFETRMENINYSRLFISTLKDLEERLNINIKSVIISGDLANKSLPKEYQKVKQFLENILCELKLDKMNFLIVPGNHDINRTHLEDKYEDYLADKGQIEPYMLHEDKFKKFKDFYDEFYKDTSEIFDVNKAISTKRYIKELNLLILGVNSVYRESFRGDDHVGYINYDNLKSELEEINKEYSDCYKIAVFHHSPKIISGHNQGIIENWSPIQELFSEYNISVYLYGHTHANLREAKNGVKKYDYVGCGSFALCDNSIGNYFNIYILEDHDENTLKFKLSTYRFMPGYEERFEIGEWKLEDDKSGEVEVLKNYLAKSTKVDQINEKPLAMLKEKENPFSEIEEDEIQQLLEQKTEEIIEYSKTINNFSLKFMNVINERKLFKSGHFHWGKNSRSHGWLDTNSLLSDYEYLKLSINSLLHLIDENSMQADLVIGIGMEGNLLAPSVAIVLGAEYTYIPVTSRQNCDFENKIGINKSKSVLMVTDTVFSGETVNQIINNNKEFFEKVDNINLVSIFYTGSLTEELKQIKNLKYRYVCDKIKINYCMNNNHQSCPIYLNRLDTIYEL